jgi:hypothetical protein
MKTTARSKARIALTQSINQAVAAEAKTDSANTIGRYTGYTNGQHTFTSINGGTLYAQVLSTSEPVIGESYLLQKMGDVVTVKPRPRL